MTVDSQPAASQPATAGEAVTYAVHDRVALITINRPSRRNALDSTAVAALEAAWQRLMAGPERAAVLTGAGEQAFSVGLDLKDPPDDMWRAVPGVGVEVDKPVVAAISGWCVGGAFVLVQMADLCVAAESARLYYPEARIGLTGGLIAGIAGRVPHKVAMEFMLLGEPMSAQRAYEVGMVNRVVPDGTQTEAALAIAHRLAGMAPLVVQTLKGFVNELLPAGPGEPASRTRARLARIRASADAQEGVAAFKEKREPRFQGR